MKILVIDGQGGRLGKLLCEKIIAELPNVELVAVGTNSLATSAFIKGGAKNIATGENAVIFCSKSADIIIGPVGICVANSLLGEISPKMAEAVGSSSAKKILIPINKCSLYIAGTGNQALASVVDDAISSLKTICK